jgi:ABC-2 type transport system permease protein
MTLTRLLARRYRLQILAWTVLLVLLSGATVSAYQSTYPTPEQRRVATELAQQNAATTLMYGHLRDPGTPAQFFVWEVGAIVTLLAAVAGVLLGVALTRSLEDDGSLELLRSAGVGPRVPIRAALAVLGAVALAVALGCAGAVGLSAGRVDGITWPGAFAFGGVAGTTFLTFATAVVLLAQVIPTPGGARTAGFTLLAAAFALRAIGDSQDLSWPGRLSPLGLRGVVRPFDGNRWWVLALALVVPVVLAGLAQWVCDRREFGAGLVSRRDRREARPIGGSRLGFAVRLSRRSAVVWTVAVASIGTLFTAMGSGAVTQSRSGDLDGFLGAQLDGADPVAGFLAYSGTTVALIVCCYAVLSVLRVHTEEDAGLTGQVLATGGRRWAPLARQVVVTATGALVILLSTGVLGALVAPLTIDGADVAPRAFAYAVGQWPAALAAAGWTALLVGVLPRATSLAWAPLVASGVLALLGNLLGVPEKVQALGVLQHVPDVGGQHPDGSALLLLVGFATAATTAGLVAMSRRDLTAG